LFGSSAKLAQTESQLTLGRVMASCRHPLLLVALLAARASASESECFGDSAAEGEGEEACHLQLGQQRPKAESAPVVILDRKVKDTWGYSSSWNSGETDEWVTSDPCNKTGGLSWHANLPYVNGVTFRCLGNASCPDKFKPHDKGGYRYINFKIYVPPGNHGKCSGDLFGQELSEGLMMQLTGEDKKVHSMPAPLKGESGNHIKKSKDGMYWVCMNIPHVQQDPVHGEWARISVQNWPQNTDGHQGSFEIYLDYVSLANTCYLG